MEKIIIVCPDDRKFLVCINRKTKNGNNVERGFLRIKSFKTDDKLVYDKGSMNINHCRNLFSAFNHIHFLIENGEAAMGSLEEKETRFNWKKLKFVKTYAFECHVTPSDIKLSGTLEEIFY